MSGWIRRASQLDAFGSQRRANPPLYHDGVLPAAPTRRPTPQPAEPSLAQVVSGLPQDVRKRISDMMDAEYDRVYQELNPEGLPLSSPEGKAAHEAALQAAEAKVSKDVIAVARSEREVARTAAFNDQNVSPGELAAEVRSNMATAPSAEGPGTSDLGGDAFTRKEQRPGQPGEGPQGPLGQPWSVGVDAAQRAGRPSVDAEQASLMGAIDEATARGDLEQADHYREQLDQLMAGQEPSNALDLQFREQEILDRLQYLKMVLEPVGPNPQMRPEGPSTPLGERVGQATRRLDQSAPDLPENSAGRFLYDQIADAIELRFAADGTGLAATAVDSQSPISIGLPDQRSAELAAMQLSERYGLRPPGQDPADVRRFYAELVDSVAEEKMRKVRDVGRRVPATPEPSLGGGQPLFQRTTDGIETPQGEIASISVPTFEIQVPSNIRVSSGKTILRPQRIGGGRRLAYFEPVTRMVDGQIVTESVPVQGSNVVRFVQGDEMRLRQGAEGQRSFDAPDRVILVATKPDGTMVMDAGDGSGLKPITKEDIYDLRLQGFQAETANVGVPGSLSDALATQGGREVFNVTDVNPAQRTYSQADPGSPPTPDATINPETVAAEIRNLIGPVSRPGDYSQGVITASPQAAARIVQLLDDVERAGGSKADVLAQANNLPDSNAPGAKEIVKRTEDALQKIAGGESVPAAPVSEPRTSTIPSVGEGIVSPDSVGSWQYSYPGTIIGQIGEAGLAHVKKASQGSASVPFEAWLDHKVRTRSKGAGSSFGQAATASDPLAHIAMSRARREALAGDLAQSFTKLAEIAQGPGGTKAAYETLKGGEALGIPDDHRVRLTSILDREYGAALEEVASEFRTYVEAEFPQAAKFAKQQEVTGAVMGSPIESADTPLRPELQQAFDKIEGALNVDDLNAVRAEIDNLEWESFSAEEIRALNDAARVRENEILSPSQDAQDILSGVGVRSPEMGGNSPAATAQIPVDPSLQATTSVDGARVDLARQVLDVASSRKGEMPFGLTPPAETRAGTRTPSEKRLREISSLDKQYEQLLEKGDRAGAMEARRKRDAIVARIERRAEASESAMDIRRRDVNATLYGDRQADSAAGEAEPGSDTAQRLQELLDAPVAKRDNRGLSGGGQRESLYESIFGTRSTSATAVLELLDPDVPASKTFDPQIAKAKTSAERSRLIKRQEKLQELKGQVKASGGLNAVARDMIANYATNTGEPITGASANADALGNLTADMLRIYREQTAASPAPLTPAVEPDAKPGLVESILERLRQGAKEETPTPNALDAVAENIRQLAEAARQKRPDFNPDDARRRLEGVSNLTTQLRQSGDVPADRIAAIDQAVSELGDAMALNYGRPNKPLERPPYWRPRPKPPAPVGAPSRIVIPDQELRQLVSEGMANISEQDAPELQAQLNGDFYAVGERKARLRKELADVDRNLQNPLDLDDQMALSRKRQGIQEELDSISRPGRRAAFSDDRVQLKMGTDSDGRKFVQVARNTSGTNQPAQLTSPRKYYLTDSGEGTVALLMEGNDVQLASRRPETTSNPPPDQPLDWPEDLPRLGESEPASGSDQNFSYEGTPFDYEEVAEPAAQSPRPPEATVDRIRQAVGETAGDTGPARANDAEAPAAEPKPVKKNRIFNRKNASRAGMLGAVGAAYMVGSNNEEIGNRVRELLGGGGAGNGLPGFMSSASASDIQWQEDTNNPEDGLSEEELLMRVRGSARPAQYFTYYNPLPR